MTPFGAKLRSLREARGITARELAARLNVTPAYLSALEHGHRGRPSRRFVELVCQYFGIIWDEAEALQATARRSHPRVVVDSGGLTPTHVELANVIASRLREFSEAEAQELLAELAKRGTPQRPPLKRARKRGPKVPKMPLSPRARAGH